MTSRVQGLHSYHSSFFSFFHPYGEGESQGFPPHPESNQPSAATVYLLTWEVSLNCSPSFPCSKTRASHNLCSLQHYTALFPPAGEEGGYGSGSATCLHECTSSAVQAFMLLEQCLLFYLNYRCKASRNFETMGRGTLLFPEKKY